MITENILEISHNHPKEELKIKYKNGKIKVIHMSYSDFENMLKTGNFKLLDNV